MRQKIDMAEREERSIQVEPGPRSGGCGARWLGEGQPYLWLYHTLSLGEHHHSPITHFSFSSEKWKPSLGYHPALEHPVAAGLSASSPTELPKGRSHRQRGSNGRQQNLHLCCLETRGSFHRSAAAQSTCKHFTDSPAVRFR